MEDNNLIKINVVLSYKDKQIPVIVVCKNELAIMYSTDTSLTKKLYKAELRDGKLVRYDPVRKLLLEKHKGMNSQQIAEKISAELKRQGGKPQISYDKSS